MSIPKLLTLEEFTMATELGILVHYGVVPKDGRFDYIMQEYWAWKQEIRDNFKGATFYDKHVNWYKVEFSKLNRALK